MKLPRCVTCHPAPVKIPPDTSPTDVRFVSGSKIVALPAGEGGGGAGAGTFPPVLVGGGGVGVDVPPVVPTTELPVPFVTLDVPIKGDAGVSRVQPATNAIAIEIADSRQDGVRAASIGVDKIGLYLSHLSHAGNGGTAFAGREDRFGSILLTVYVMRKDNNSTLSRKRERRNGAKYRNPDVTSGGAPLCY